MRRRVSDPHGEFRGKNILIEKQEIATTARIPESPDRNGLRFARGSRRKLFDRRAQRPRPHLDDKVLTAWNGLAISAFAKCGAALNEPRYLRAAAKAAGFLRTQLSSEKGLLRSWRGEASAIPGFAEDYAFLIQGLLDLYEAGAAPGSSSRPSRSSPRAPRPRPSPCRSRTPQGYPRAPTRARRADAPRR